jgi:PilX N-terminal
MKKNEDGFVLVMALVFLVVLSLLAVAGVRMTTTELKIAGNERVAKVNFYNAEAAAYEGVQRNLNKNRPEDLLPAHPDFVPADNSELQTVTDQTDDMANLDGDSDGEIDQTVATDLPAALLDGGTVELLVVLNAIPAGSSLALGTTRLYDYTSYGYAEKNNGKSIVKVGFKKQF